MTALEAAATPLDPATVARLGQLRLLPRFRVVGRLQGGNASRRMGSAIEFADVREYVPGDDLRRIDPAASRRHHRLQLTVTEADDDAPAHLVVDASASMRFGPKLDALREVAAALVLLASRDGARIVLADATPVTGPWLRGPGALPVAARMLADLAPADGAAPRPPGPLARALHVTRRASTSGPVVLITDLLFDGWQEVVERLGATHRDTLLIHLVGRDDLEPPFHGDVRVVDAETGRDVEVAGDGQARARYLAVRDQWLDDVRAACRRSGVMLARHVDDEDLLPFVAARLRGLGVVG